MYKDKTRVHLGLAHHESRSQKRARVVNDRYRLAQKHQFKDQVDHIINRRMMDEEKSEYDYDDWVDSATPM